ncbi:hypothetical protein LMG3458_02937 [Achromobacter deleyi]|uniref:HTH cro/C1-type domain-containing protein n=1 Tax=Achromobacter deleyi TaxID=1353891 RepID=A0A6S7A4N5_9BURK|nr:hypothetical protein [Achromobacter deleyi]CAB3706157.1 hypothetical protein LMG3458_02937 [Achromobacter deleyi]CAB3880272.1 hypothetical protein LMG3482_03257 [Achromobacter deleyi]CAB3911606.1 hypothetical protein LMG3481_04806 [Achromobacter deleyi]
MPLPRFPLPAAAPPPSRDDDFDEAPDLTTRAPASLPAAVYALPVAIRLALAAGECSALRAWRSHRNLSARTLADLAGLNLPTLHAIDCGFVGLCEWTVAPIARAMRIGDSQLLLAQRLADQAAENTCATTT